MSTTRRLAARLSGDIALFEARQRVYNSRSFLKSLEELERTIAALRSSLRRGGGE